MLIASSIQPPVSDEQQFKRTREKTQKQAPSVCHTSALRLKQPVVITLLHEHVRSQTARPILQHEPPASLKRKHFPNNQSDKVKRCLREEKGRFFGADHKRRRRVLVWSDEVSRFFCWLRVGWHMHEESTRPGYNSASILRTIEHGVNRRKRAP
jgi:hypothetical protein